MRTIRRWEVRENDPPPYLADAIRQRILPLVSPKATHHSPFTFIDLFAGIGGIRLGFEQQGGHCVFTSEWNAFAQKTYLANFSHDTDYVFVGDITKIDEKDIPIHPRIVGRFSLPTIQHCWRIQEKRWVVHMVLNAKLKAHYFLMSLESLLQSAQKRSCWKT